MLHVSQSTLSTVAIKKQRNQGLIFKIIPPLKHSLITFTHNLHTILAGVQKLPSAYLEFSILLTLVSKNTFTWTISNNFTYDYSAVALSLEKRSDKTRLTGTSLYISFRLTLLSSWQRTIQPKSTTPSSQGKPTLSYTATRNSYVVSPHLSSSLHHRFSKRCSGLTSRKRRRSENLMVMRCR